MRPILQEQLDKWTIFGVKIAVYKIVQWQDICCCSDQLVEMRRGIPLRANEHRACRARSVVAPRPGARHESNFAVACVDATIVVVNHDNPRTVILASGLIHASDVGAEKNDTAADKQNRAVKEKDAAATLINEGHPKLQEGSVVPYVYHFARYFSGADALQTGKQYEPHKASAARWRPFAGSRAAFGSGSRSSQHARR